MSNYSRAVEMVDRLEAALVERSKDLELVRNIALIRAQLALVDAAGAVPAGGALPAPIVLWPSSAV